MVRRALSVSLVVVGLVLAVPGAASAAVVGLERVGATSASTSAGKSVTAACPAGKRVVGAGGEVSVLGGDVLIDDVRPAADLGSVTVNALEDESGTPSDWQVFAYAVCAYPLPGLERVSATSPLNSANKSVAAACPAGKRLLGTGMDLNTFVGQVELDGLVPNAGLTAVTANAIEDETGNPTNWSVTAYGICANPVQGLERTTATSTLASGTSNGVVAQCPAGKQATGLGVDVNSFVGQTSPYALIFGTGVASTVTFASEDNTGNPTNWSVTAHAICANTALRVVADSPSDSASSKTVDASCPAGKLATGAGADLTGGFGEVVIDEAFPLSPQTAVRASGFEDDTGAGRNWSVRAYAICASPLPGLIFGSDDSAADSADDKFALTECPAGDSVLSASGAIAGAAGVSGQVLLQNIAAENGAGTALAGVFAAEDEDRTAGNWAVSSYAICADPPPGIQRVIATSESDSEEIKSVTATCPAGTHLLGTGAQIGAGFFDFNREIVIDDIRPDAALRSVTVTGIEDETGYAFDWQIRAHAMCAGY